MCSWPRLCKKVQNAADNTSYPTLPLPSVGHVDKFLSPSIACKKSVSGVSLVSVWTVQYQYLAQSGGLVPVSFWAVQMANLAVQSW